ncbi:MAG: glyceraldehyde-3-phosphate dehydrogenase, partial [Deltaproteobacteria bacterium]|nr:glyceraldehyde-3-phosphate dehydrogenase [Deltaproteobacteria bacterium]
MNTNNNFSREISLGVNGFGRIGKLAVWHHIGRKFFNEIVVNLGRDSTYGSLQGFLYGHQSSPVIENLNEADGSMTIDGCRIKFLRSDRNPDRIQWRNHNVRLVVDTTGKFLDPTISPDHPEGSCRGHIESGAEKVVLSAPFKIKDEGSPIPDDAVTIVMGINDSTYDPRQHQIISTTCLAHMMKPLLNYFGPAKILSASMATIHAATGSQEVLDRLPKTGQTDLRKNRSVMNNIILTTTGAARTLSQVIPEMANIGFIAESVRIPTSTGSLIILVVNLQEEITGDSIRRDLINSIYKQASEEDPEKYLLFSDKQNVSSDIIGLPRAAVIIEGLETHTRTATVSIDLKKVPGLDADLIESLPDTVIKTPVTQAVIYGWYDNEKGSYV